MSLKNPAASIKSLWSNKSFFRNKSTNIFSKRSDFSSNIPEFSSNLLEFCSNMPQLFLNLLEFTWNIPQLYSNKPEFSGPPQIPWIQPLLRPVNPVFPPLCPQVVWSELQACLWQLLLCSYPPEQNQASLDPEINQATMWVNISQTATSSRFITLKEKPESWLSHLTTQ